MIFNNRYNFIYSVDCPRILLLLACMGLFLNGTILSPNSTIISFVLAESEDKNDSKEKEVSSDSNKEEKSSEKNSNNDDNGAEKSDEQDDPPKQDDSTNEEESPADQEQIPPIGEERPEEKPREEKQPKEMPPEEEPPEEEPPEQEPQPPIIITNTVTAPAVSSPSSNVDDDDDDENEGPTKFGFIDSFFTDQTVQGSVIAGTTSGSSTTQDIPPVTKQEVEPGEGDSILAIVLINRGFSDVTSIRASLDFPSGFSSNVTPKNIDNDTSLASYNGLVEAGKTFTLYFPVNISKDTQVGKEYTASLNIDYFNIAEKDEENMRDRSIKIPFKLSGKVILDTISFSSAESLGSVNETLADKNSMISYVVSLIPGEPNIVQTLVKNEGSAAATGVIVEVSSRNQQDQFDNNNLIPTTSNNNGNSSSTTVQQSTVIPLISAGITTFNVGTIPAGESVQINPVIFASNSVGSILENIDLRISYNNAYGYKKTLDKSMGVHILPSSPQSGLTLSSSVTTKTTNNLPVVSDNNDRNSGDYDLISANNHDANRQNLTHPTTQVSQFTSEDSSFVPNDIESNNTSSTDTSFDTSSDKNTVSLIAGRVDELNFNITNTKDNPIIDAVVSLDSESNSIKILGDSKWNLNSMGPHTTQQFQTTVFASKSLINSPVSFKISIQYLDDNQAKSDSFNLGANVIGDITVNINDLAINYIGGNPNLVGNILNKGNTLALFTTIEILTSSTITANQSDGQLPASPQTLEKETILVPASTFPQYLGDLEENSPLPFSIPLAINNNTASGIYPVSLKVTYSDDLRNSYSIINNGSVEFISPITTSNNGQEFFGNNNLLLIVIILAIAGAIVLIVVRRLRSHKNTGGQNMRSDHRGGDSGNDNDKGNIDDIESLLGGEDSNFKENFQKK